MPIWLGGSASSVDHGILHPDPEVNELWISNMNGWETIVLDLNIHKVTAYIPTPNGGDTHSGGFVRYNLDGSGELMADMAGPKASMSEIVSQRVAARSPQPDPFANAPAATPAAAAGDPAALGRIIFEETAGGVGCAYCHGMDGTGNPALGGPDIRGETSERVRGALSDVDFMSEIRLNDDEITAVVSHLQQLAELLRADDVYAVRFQVRECSQVLGKAFDDDLGNFGRSGHDGSSWAVISRIRSSAGDCEAFVKRL